MFDLAFLAVAIFAIAKASKGEYHETACNIALVVGILAGVLGCVTGIMNNAALLVVLNVIVIVGAFGIRFAARHLANLYNEQQIAYTEEWERERRERARFSDPDRPPVYTDDNFDDEELRFGKGGYKDSNRVSLDKQEIYTGRNFADAEPLFGKVGCPDPNKKVSLEKVGLEKKKVNLEKKDINTDNKF